MYKSFALLSLMPLVCCPCLNTSADMYLLQEYYTSGFLSLQAAIDGYVLGLSTAHEAALGPLGTTIPVAPDSPFVQSEPQYWTAWGAAFPTAAYDHNQFYDAVGPMLGLVLCLSLLFPLSMLVRGIVEVRLRSAYMNDNLSCMVPPLGQRRACRDA